MKVGERWVCNVCRQRIFPVLATYDGDNETEQRERLFNFAVCSKECARVAYLVEALHALEAAFYRSRERSKDW